MRLRITMVIALCFGGSAYGQPVRGQPLGCGGAGYKATYTPATKGDIPTVDVTFRGTRPTSAVAEAALKRCMKLAADTMFITKELMGTVWCCRGNDDDEVLTLPDGSDHLVYDPTTKRIRTWNERSGVAPTLTQANGYVVKYEEQQIAGRAGEKFATISVVFARQPTERVAYETVIAELVKAIDRSRRAISSTAFAHVGNKANPASWKGIKGSHGKYISAAFDPKAPTRIKSAGGDDLVPTPPR